QTFGQGERCRAGVGFNLTSDGNYDMVNKKLKNVGEGTASSEVITKHQIATAMIDKHNNNQNIDFKNTYNVINSKQQTFNEMNAIRNTLVCYEDVRDVFPNCWYLNMGDNKIKGLPTTSQAGDEATSKAYVEDNFFKLSGASLT
ncbi:unnamed protein product, partial [Porites evermanni]